jgi:Raf kinase inhibitor-like YbhB/YbcL family protein
MSSTKFAIGSRAIAAALALLAACTSGTGGGRGGAGGDQAGRGGEGGGAGPGGAGGAGGETQRLDAAVRDAGGTGGSLAPDAAVDTSVRDADLTLDTAASPDVAPTSGPFALTSSAFKDGDAIAAMYRCPPDANISPPLSWTPGPAGTRSYAITLAHATSIHWQLWDIPAEVTSLPKDVAKVAMPPVPAGAKQTQTGTNGEMTAGYIGPCPQSATVSLYPYTVYALKVATLPGVTPASTPKAVADAIKANTLATAVLTVNGHK